MLFGLLHRACVALCLGVVVMLAGCTTAPYSYGSFVSDRGDRPDFGAVVIEYGKPSKRLDRMKAVVDYPKRLIPKSWRDDNEMDHDKVVDEATEYLTKNQLTDVAVFVNHYDPRGQWQRLRDNDRIAPAWRYSLGVISWTGYTLLPGRVFGRTSYDPFTNSLHLNDGSPVVGLHSAAYAKQVHSRKQPGLYVAMGKLPVVSGLQQGQCASDIVGYARAERNWEAEDEAYRVLYPRVGAETFSVASVFVPLWWAQPLVSMGGAAAGRVAGWSVSERRKAERESEGAPPAVVDGEVELAAYAEPVDSANGAPSEP